MFKTSKAMYEKKIKTTFESTVWHREQKQIFGFLRVTELEQKVS